MADAKKMFSQLHWQCLDLGFASVGPIGDAGFVCRLGGERPLRMEIAQDRVCWPKHGPMAAGRYLAAIEALACAKKIGFHVTVNDEGGLWKSRDRRKFLEYKEMWDKYPDPREFFRNGHGKDKISVCH